jgi:hypothetical protein
MPSADERPGGVVLRIEDGGEQGRAILYVEFNF